MRVAFRDSSAKPQRRTHVERVKNAYICNVNDRIIYFFLTRSPGLRCNPDALIDRAVMLLLCNSYDDVMISRNFTEALNTYIGVPVMLRYKKNVISPHYIIEINSIKITRVLRTPLLGPQCVSWTKSFCLLR